MEYYTFSLIVLLIYFISMAIFGIVNIILYPDSQKICWTFSIMMILFIGYIIYIYTELREIYQSQQSTDIIVSPQVSIDIVSPDYEFSQISTPSTSSSTQSPRQDNRV